MLRLLRRALPFLTVTILAAAVYDGVIFYGRWRDGRDAAEQRQAKEVEDARRTIDSLGGGGLKILNFYSAPAILRRGETGRLCYGVYGATAVRIDPPVKELYPAIAHCFDVAPSKSTRYTLTAEDGKGNVAKEHLEVLVR